MASWPRSGEIKILNLILYLLIPLDVSRLQGDHLMHRRSTAQRCTNSSPHSTALGNLPPQWEAGSPPSHITSSLFPYYLWNHRASEFPAVVHWGLINGVQAGWLHERSQHNPVAGNTDIILPMVLPSGHWMRWRDGSLPCRHQLRQLKGAGAKLRLVPMFWGRFRAVGQVRTTDTCPVLPQVMQVVFQFFPNWNSVLIRHQLAILGLGHHLELGTMKFWKHKWDCTRDIPLIIFEKCKMPQMIWIL